MSILAHVTHEAVQKIGGIGAVLQGLLTTRQYNRNIERTFLIGPQYGSSADVEESLGEGGEVLYTSSAGIRKTPYADALQKIEETYHVAIVYGKRRFVDDNTGVTIFPEIILINVSYIHPEHLSLFKLRLFERFSIESARYDDNWEYEEYIRLAEPGYCALRALIGGDTETPCFVIAHEFMGMPFVLKTILEDDPNMKTIFYAHEVATVRPIVENHPGHDTMFYNALRRGSDEGKFIQDVFGDQYSFHKHALIDKAHLCDNIFAVGDLVVQELRFLAQPFCDASIDLVYNGIPSARLNLSEKLDSKRRLQEYAEHLLGYNPDYVLTHVTRLVRSKGLWRDLQLLRHMDSFLASSGKTAVLFILSTEIGSGRSSEEVHSMEAEYGWPLHHRVGAPDLVGSEIDLNNDVTAFNLDSTAIKVVFVNQFGWSRERCGARMPENMEFMDIRKGSDAELGQSIYEPFGIAQVEPMSFGAICVLSNACGCCGFVGRVTDGADVPNVIIADYARLNHLPDSLEGLLAIGETERDQIEVNNSWDIAEKLVERLPRDDRDVDEMIQRGYEIAVNMSWEVVVENYFLPGLQRALDRHST